MTGNLNITNLGDRMLAKNILLLDPSDKRTTRQSPLTTSTTYNDKHAFIQVKLG